ncbi:hypothetical protein ROZALSC1DRAFT_26250, partial [Rozella allomycis CSF55]
SRTRCRPCHANFRCLTGLHFPLDEVRGKTKTLAKLAEKVSFNRSKTYRPIPTIFLGYIQLVALIPCVNILNFVHLEVTGPAVTMALMHALPDYFTRISVGHISLFRIVSLIPKRHD